MGRRKRIPEPGEYQTGDLTDKLCPKCGAKLFTNGIYLWCSSVGSRKNADVACSFGVFQQISIPGFRRRYSKLRPPQEQRYRIDKTTRQKWREQIYRMLEQGEDRDGVLRKVCAAGVRQADAKLLVGFVVKTRERLEQK